MKEKEEALDQREKAIKEWEARCQIGNRDHELHNNSENTRFTLSTGIDTTNNYSITR